MGISGGDGEACVEMGNGWGWTISVLVIFVYNFSFADKNTLRTNYDHNHISELCLFAPSRWCQLNEEGGAKMMEKFSDAEMEFELGKRSKRVLTL